MDLHKLQEEINKLLYHYYNALGIIQRDFDKDDIDETITNISNEIKECKNKILTLLESKIEKLEISKDYNEILKDGSNFVEDATYLIDRLTKH